MKPDIKCICCHMSISFVLRLRGADSRSEGCVFESRRGQIQYIVFCSIAMACFLFDILIVLCIFVEIGGGWGAAMRLIQSFIADHGVEASARKSQASFQNSHVSSEALSRIRLE